MITDPQILALAALDHGPLDAGHAAARRIRPDVLSRLSYRGLANWQPYHRRRTGVWQITTAGQHALVDATLRRHWRRRDLRGDDTA